MYNFTVLYSFVEMFYCTVEAPYTPDVVHVYARYAFFAITNIRGHIYSQCNKTHLPCICWDETDLIVDF